MSVRAILAWALLVALAGCGGDDGGQGRGGASTHCTAGEKKACTCADGSSTLRVCEGDGSWGDCPCGTNPGDDVVGGDDTVLVNPDTVGEGTTGDDTAGDDTAGDDTAGDDIAGDGTACVRQCNGKQCGPDSCGGTCGACPDGLTCGPAYQCQEGPCEGDCAGRECGDDGCGGSCGACDVGLACDGTGQCVSSCTPQCAGKQCGPDGCNGSCGGCSNGKTCNASGQCVVSCTPQCAGKQCGPDGCGGSCGTCAAGFECDLNGWCKTAPPGLTCQQLFVECFPTCAQSDTTCVQGCYDKLTASGKTEADALMNCMQTNGCYDAADVNACVNEKCFGEILGCFHGSKTCAQVTACIDQCSSSVDTCVGDCLAEGTTEVQIGLYNQMDDCLVNLCCPTDTALCSQTAGQTCITNALAAGGGCAWPTIACP